MTTKRFPELAAEPLFLSGLDPALPTLIERALPGAIAAEESAATSAEGLKAIVASLGRDGLLRYVARREDGGAEENVSSISLCYVRERLGYVSPLIELAFAMQGLGSYPITLAAQESSEQWLRPVLSGESVAAFALTEAEAGSDVAAMQSSLAAVDNGYVLRGEKRFISNAGIADQYVVFARDPGGKVSTVVVRATDPGVSVKAQHVLGGHPIGEVRFDEVFVPHAHRLGAEGDGMKLALGTLHRFRTTVGAAALGFAQRALDEAIAHTRIRKQFGAPLSDLPVVQMRLAEMACDIESARLLVYRAALAADTGAPREVVARQGSMAKLMATEAAQRVIDTAVQLLGGSGVLTDGIVARLYTEVRALRIYEGASDVQKLLIARALLSS